jgi:hypothetical protein
MGERGPREWHVGGRVRGLGGGGKYVFFLCIVRVKKNMQ